jgi:hypothetical protein
MEFPAVIKPHYNLAAVHRMRECRLNVSRRSSPLKVSIDGIRIRDPRAYFLNIGEGS